MEELTEMMRNLRAGTAPLYHCLDLFGATRRVSSTFKRSGYQAVAYDIKLSPKCDVTSEDGFKNLMKLSSQQLAKHSAF